MKYVKRNNIIILNSTNILMKFNINFKIKLFWFTHSIKSLNNYILIMYIYIYINKINIIISIIQYFSNN